MIQLKIDNNNIVLPKTKVILTSSIESILPKDIKIIINELWSVNPNNPAELKASFYIQDPNMEQNILNVTATIKPTDIPKIYQLVGFKLESSNSIIQEMNKEKELFEVSPLNAHFIMNQFDLSELMENLTPSSAQDEMNFITAFANSKSLYEDNKDVNYKNMGINKKSLYDEYYKNMGVSSKSLYEDYKDMGISGLDFFELVEDENTMGKDLMYQIDIEEPRTIEMFYSDIKDHITKALIQIVKKHKEKNDTNLQYYVEDFNILNFYFMPENYNLISEKYDGCQSILQKRDITLFYNEKYNNVFFAESKLDYKTASYTEVSTLDKLRLTINEELALLRYFIYKYNIE